MGTQETVTGEHGQRPLSRAKAYAGSREGRHLTQGVPQYTCGTLKNTVFGKALCLIQCII